MKRIAIASAAVLAGAIPARADPIFTPFLTAAFAQIVTAVGLPATVFGVSTAAILATVTTIALGVGLSLALAPKPPKPSAEAGQVPTQQPIPYRQFGYGTVRVAGAFMFKENCGGRLVQVVALLSHKITEFKKLYLNDDLITVFSSYTMSPYLDGPMQGHVGATFGDNRYGNGLIAVDTRLGEDTETYYRSLGFLTNDDGTWGAAHRGDGIASAIIIAQQAEQAYFSGYFPYGAPIPSFVLDTAMVLDPRETDGDPDDPSTFRFRKNAALCILHFICFNQFGYQKDYTTAILPVLDDWLDQIDYCDEGAALKAGGTEPRYQLNGWITTEQDRKTALEAMLATCDGWLCQRGDGSVILRVGKFIEPTIILTDDDIAGWKLDTNVPSDQKVNRATAKWTNPDTNYSTVETDPIENTTDQALREGPIRSAQLDLGWVQSNGQASRLLKIEMNKQAKNVRGTLMLRLSGMNACYERWVRVQSNTIPRLSNAVIEIRKPNISLVEGRCQVDFVLSGSDIYDYDPATDESNPPIVPERPASGAAPVPTGVAAVAEQHTDATGGYDIVVDVSWDVPQQYGADRLDLSYKVRWRVQPVTGEDPPYTVLNVQGAVPVASRVSASIGVVPQDVIIEIEVASVSANGFPSGWSDTTYVDTSVDTVAPDTPTNLTASTTVTGAVDLSAKAPNSPNFDSIQFYRSAVGDPFSSATPVGSPVYGAANATLVYTDVVAAGSYDYWAAALNVTEVASSPAGPATGTSI